MKQWPTQWTLLGSSCHDKYISSNYYGWFDLKLHVVPQLVFGPMAETKPCHCNPANGAWNILSKFLTQTSSA